MNCEHLLGRNVSMNNRQEFGYITKCYPDEHNIDVVMLSGDSSKLHVVKLNINDTEPVTFIYRNCFRDLVDVKYTKWSDEEG